MAPSVSEFYTGKNIFITGGTGFVGKSIVEKLLRSCSGVKTIYLLMRTKKGVSSEDRLKELGANKVFDLVRSQNPDVFKKLKLIAGDVTEDELGISDEDKDMLRRETNIVFHSAACVRFDQKLKDAVHMNTRGTLKMLTLAETMTNLEAFIHLSTAYCRCELDVLEERVYKAVHSPRKIMDMTEWMDDELLDYVEPKVIISEPNTYSYTKAITEDLVAEYGSKFPIAIARPSIVTAAWKEPIPGWVDNLNGPTGLIIGSGKGVIRTMHCEPSYKADAISVDVVANGCILIAYATALDKLKETQVYNLTLSGVINITWREVIELGEKWVNEYPYTVALWYPGGAIKSYWITHQICLILFHVIPAYFVDLLLFLLGKKTFMVNVQKRISHGLSVLQHYTVKEWHFTNKNFLNLRNRITKKEDEVFFTDCSILNPEDYLKDYVKGTRQFCCKEDPSTLPRARRLHKIRYIVDRFVKIAFFGLVFYFFYSNFHVFMSLFEYLDNALTNVVTGNMNCCKGQFVEIEFYIQFDCKFSALSNGIFRIGISLKMMSFTSTDLVKIKLTK